MLAGITGNLEAARAKQQANTARVKSGSLATTGRTPPSEARLWKRGKNSTDYGEHFWTPRSVAEVSKRYAARGNPIVLDVEHLGTAKDGKPAPTAGYAKLDIRNGEPWLVFEWSDYGRRQIESGERRFLSGEYDIDKTTGEILALYRVSLVADPGTHNAQLLASARTTETKASKMKMNNPPKFFSPSTPDEAAPTMSFDELMRELAAMSQNPDNPDCELAKRALELIEGGRTPYEAASRREPDLAVMVSRLSKRELAKCEAAGVKPAHYCATLAAMKGVAR